VTAALAGVPDGGLPLVDGFPIEPPERAQFDFWLGSWRVRHLVGSEVDGTNEVCWTLDGRVLWEQFAAGTDPFTGWSFSVPVIGRGWVQTWVDNAGGYLDFVGGWCGDRMVLERGTGKATPTHQRMTWHSITDRGFVWDLGARTGPFASWDVVWRLRYERL
jgi:hypothetical protein